MNFSLMYVYVLRFYKIFLLTYFHVKISVRAHEAKNILRAFLAKENQYKTMFLCFKKRNRTYLLMNKGPSCLAEKFN